MTVWVLMTAMPPTLGHQRLIDFAAMYATVTKQQTRVVVSTQPSEPFPLHRFYAIANHFNDRRNVDVIHHHDEISQDATSQGFWDMWFRILTNYGARPGDTYISSETYGKRLAEVMNGKFMPYDVGRKMLDVKGTRVRQSPLLYWDEIMPEFQSSMQRTVTIFGAESTGKSTLTRDIVAEAGYWGENFNSTVEYARPYLENTENVITTESMTDIWKGQAALQLAAQRWKPKAAVTVQDTDLFSTVGYWEFPHWQDTLGPVPEMLITDALNMQSDLYIITPSTIPFEEDPLRYGGNVREGSDEYWINVCEKYGLNYVVLEKIDKFDRTKEAYEHCVDLFLNKWMPLMSYERKHNA